MFGKKRERDIKFNELDLDEEDDIEDLDVLMKEEEADEQLETDEVEQQESDELPGVEEIELEALEVQTVEEEQQTPEEQTEDALDDIELFEIDEEDDDFIHEDLDEDDFQKPKKTKHKKTASPKSTYQDADLEDEDEDEMPAPVWVKTFLHSKYSIAAGIVALLLVLGGGVAMLFSSDKTATAAVTVTEPAAVTTQEETTQPMPLQGMKLEAVADENSIVAKILDADGSALSGHGLTIRLYSGSLADNREKIDAELSRQKELATANAAVSAANAGTQAAAKSDSSDDGAKVYADEDKDGTVAIKNLEPGTYALMVEAEPGFEVPDPTEATIVKFEVIEDIMEQVVAEDANTAQEDPQANREAEIPAVPVPTIEATTAVQNKTILATIKTLTQVDGKTVYTSDYSDKKYKYSEIESYINDDNKTTVLLEDGSTITGYIYETGTVDVTSGTVDIITKLLVETDETANARLLDDVPVLWAQASAVTTKTGTTAGTTAAATTAAATTKAPTTAAPTTAAPTTKAPTTAAPTTTAPTTAAPTTTAPTTTAPTTAATTTTTPTTTAAPQKLYVVVELEPVVTSETKNVFDGWFADGGNMFYLANGIPMTGWHLIDGMNYYFDSKGVLSSRLVIDVSTYNGNIDWNAVKAAGISDVIVRVGYRGWGTARIVQDSRFAANVVNAKAAGLNVGAYFVTQAINTSEAVEEASFIVQAARLYGMNLPLAIDVEWAGSGSEQGRGNYLSAGERTAVINAFAETVASSGYTPMVYANRNWLNNYINSGSIVSYCQVWVAQYANIDATTYGGRYDMWQFRSDGAVSGIGTSVDISAYIR